MKSLVALAFAPKLGGGNVGLVEGSKIHHIRKSKKT
jgi:hypothetical protein